MDISKTSRASRFVSGPEGVETGLGLPMIKQFALMDQLAKSIPRPANRLEPSTKRLLEREKDGCALLNKAWHTAEEYYLSHKKDFDENVLSREYYIALFTYVLDSPFFVHFNKLTRELKSSNDIDTYPYKCYYEILYRIVISFGGVEPLVPGDGEEPLPTDNFTVYRGMSCRMKLNPKYYLVFQQFLSTTRSLEVAKTFTDPEGTLFIIEGLVPSGEVTTKEGLTIPAFAILDGIPPKIKQVQEYECLIVPCQPYRIERIVPGEEITCVCGKVLHTPEKVYLSLW